MDRLDLGDTVYIHKDDDTYNSAFKDMLFLKSFEIVLEGFMINILLFQVNKCHIK